jgi:hypothetical protein
VVEKALNQTTATTFKVLHGIRKAKDEGDFKTKNDKILEN